MLTQNELTRLRELVAELEKIEPALDGFEPKHAVETLRIYAKRGYWESTPSAFEAEWNLYRKNKAVAA